MNVRAWTDQERGTLGELCAEGHSYAEIGRRMGRSQAAVHIRATRLGLSNNRPLGAQKGGEGHPAKFKGDRAMEIGIAAEYLVCADLLLAGLKAFPSAQGMAYDVVAQYQGRLIRIAVKACSVPRARPAREGGRVCYQYALSRSGAHKTQPNRRYTTDDCELVALVAVDIKSIIYVPPTGCTWPTSFHVDPPGMEPVTGGRHGSTRKLWGAFTLTAALGMLYVNP